MLCFRGRYITTVFHHKLGSRKIRKKNKEKLHIAIALLQRINATYTYYTNIRLIRSSLWEWRRPSLRPVQAPKSRKERPQT